MNAKRMTAYRVTITLVLLVSALFGMAPLPAPRAAHAVPTPPPGSWPFYRYDMQRTNRVPSSVAKGNITQPAIKWTFPVGGGSAAWAHDITGLGGLPDGVPEIIAHDGGRVRAFNSQTGDPLWTSDLLLGLASLTFVGDVDGDGSVEVLVQAFGGSNPNWRVFVLSGATGQVRSQISGFVPEPYTVVVADATGDGKMEVFEAGFNDSNRQVFTFQNGADSPQLAASNMPQNARMPVIADLNGDGSREVLQAEEGIGGVYRVINPATWVVASTSALTMSLYPIVLVTDTLAAFTGAEILAAWAVQLSGSPAYLSLHRVGPAPGYAITQMWVHTVNSVAESTSGATAAPNLDGAGDREIVWAYQNTGSLTWRTEVVRASDGAVLHTLLDRRLCGLPFPHWGGVAFGTVNLDSDAADELILCGTNQAGVFAYDWSGSALTLKWSMPSVSLAGWNELRSVTPNALQAMPRFTADFDSDSLTDVLVLSDQSDRLMVLSGVNGAPVYTYTAPANVSIAMQYLGNLDGNPATPEVLFSGSDGYLYYLDRTLNLQRRVYAGTGTASPYVVDTNNDGRNEVVFQNASRLLINLDVLTATQQLPPKVNWSRPAFLPAFWHPFNLDSSGLWEYLIYEPDSTQSTSYTLSLITKDPNSGIETLLSSYTFTNAQEGPVLQAVAQFNSSVTPHDILVTLGYYPFRPGYALAWNGSLGAPMSQLWHLPNAANAT